MSNSSITSLASAVMLFLAMWLGLLGKPTEMSLIIVAGSIVIAFLNIDRIQRFKGAGFEAEMRQTVVEVHATLDQLRNLATASTESSLTTLMSGNFFDGTTLATRLDLHDRLIRTLEEIGVPSHQIIEADRMWRKGVGVIYLRGIRNKLEGRSHPAISNPDIDPNALEISRSLQDLLQFESWTAPPAKQIRKLIEKSNLMNSELDELIADYSHFENTGSIKRKEVFVSM
jgi:hypothetical protein